MFESKPIQEYDAAIRGRLAKWQARRVLTYVETNLDARLKVPEIARSVHLSCSHFSRAFKRTFGMTVHAWVMRRRIEIAKGMMLNTPHTLSEIALRCGLSDQSHLTRWFRRVVGETPGSWRRERYEGGDPRVPNEAFVPALEWPPRSIGPSTDLRSASAPSHWPP